MQLEHIKQIKLHPSASGKHFDSVVTRVFAYMDVPL